MFGLSRLIALGLAFCMGFGLAAGLFVGVPAAVVASYSLRDLENTNLVNIPDEKFLSPDAEVDILDLNGIELYKEDVVPNEYHLYKVGSVSGIRESGDTRVNIFGVNFDWISLTGISVVFPMDACEVYLSMKFTGEMYGGAVGDPEAVYVDRIIIVRREN